MDLPLNVVNDLQSKQNCFSRSLADIVLDVAEALNIPRMSDQGFV
jgi:hypothetical protein